MSSIDKGVEKVVHEMGRNIRVERKGNTIYGYSNGEVVFTLADRYGWITKEEQDAVKRQIRSYDSRKVRERALELERARLENLRKESINKVKSTISSKILEINQEKQKDTALIDKVNSSYNLISSKVESISKISSLLDISSLKNEINILKDEAFKTSQKVLSEYNALTTQINNYNRRVSDSMSTVEAERLNGEVKKLKTAVNTKFDCSFEAEKTNKELDLLIKNTKEIASFIKDLEKYSKGFGDTALVAKESINTIKNIKISSVKDVEQIALVIESGLEAIKTTIAVEKREENLKSLLEIEGKIASCKQIRDIEVEGTYEAIEYRLKIVNEATDVIEKFNSLSNKEFTTCSNERINAVISRATDVIKGVDANEAVYKEMKSLVTEYKEIIQKDSLEVKNYEEYLEYKNKLIEYGVDSKDIPAFNYQEYKKVKDQLTTMITVEKRNQQRTNMYLTNIETTKIMTEMGYELFATSGDKNGLVVESLFTKKGYDGVVWQIVVLADGSFNRRLLGVNKGDTQTSVEYIKEVAKELDESNESIEFLKRFNESTGSNVLVNKAVEYNSKEVENEIMKNGYHYLKGEALNNYNQRVKDEANTATAKKQGFNVKATLVTVTKGNQVKNSATNLQQSLKKSMAMSI